MSRFDAFWEQWPAGPRKVNRKGCEKKWKALKLDEQAETILAHVRWSVKYNKQWKDSFVPMPMTYLNQERWNDGKFESGRLFDRNDKPVRATDPNEVVEWIKANRRLTPEQLTAKWDWIWNETSMTGVKIPGMDAVMFKDLT